MPLIRFRLPDDADNARAPPRRDLRRRLPDPAVHAHDQHDVAASRKARTRKAFRRGDKGNADSGRLLQRNVFWFGDQRLRLDEKMAGMRAVAADAEIAGRAENFRPYEIART